MAFYDSLPFSPDTSIGYLVRRVHQIGQQRLEPVFAESGLTGSQWSALICIHVGRGRTCAELARDMAHDKGAMTRLVDALEARGWVMRRRDIGDRRHVNLELTDDGRAIALATKDRVVESWNAWLADWSDADVLAVIAGLQRLRETMDSVESCTVPA